MNDCSTILGNGREIAIPVLIISVMTAVVVVVDAVLRR